MKDGMTTPPLHTQVLSRFGLAAGMLAMFMVAAVGYMQVNPAALELILFLCLMMGLMTSVAGFATSRLRAGRLSLAVGFLCVGLSGIQLFMST